MRSARVLIIGWLLLGTAAASARADGGTVRFSGTGGGYRITVFTAPSPLRVGPADISVLVQDAASGEPLPLAEVHLSLTQPHGQTLAARASTEAATNKLLHAAQVELPASGCWDLAVTVEGPHGPVAVDCRFEAAEALPRWRELWPWITWPAAAIALFAIHQLLSRRGNHRLHG
jgi:hypothetical protein